MMLLAIGGDHAGFEFKSRLQNDLKASFSFFDFGPFSSESMDYPDVAHPLASAVESGAYSLGILLCGSGNGVCMTANKHQGIRAALCWNTELAQLARLHNNANILCIPARFVDYDSALAMVKAFIETPFEGGRHANRVNKI